MPTQAAACHNCGHPVVTGSRFCQNCGSDVSQEQANLATMSWATPPRMTVQEMALEQLRQETLGEYEILDELGRGGMATVYLAHDIALDRRVAIKVMSTALLDEGLAERFRREARTAAALNHPHIIPIYAVRERNSLLYFVMKFVAGQSLDPIVKGATPLPIPMAQVILSQAASALGYSHRRGVIHRDVKPANIMLDEDGWVVMTDFGIAKVPSAEGLTMTGVTVGTPAYMSPEQCMGKEVTGASDQYSLGVVAYEMLTGRKPFAATTAMAMMYAHFNEEPRPLRELRPEIPAELEASVLRMLAKSPEDRWPRIDDAFGAQAMAHDDPSRQHLIDMARESSNAIRAARISTPTSPVPPARRTVTKSLTAPGPTLPLVPVAGQPPTTSHPAQAPSSSGSGTPPPPTESTTGMAPGTPGRRAPTRPTLAPPRVPAAGRPPWILWTAAGGLAVAVVALLLFKPFTRSGSPPAVPRDSSATQSAGGSRTDSTRADTSGRVAGKGAPPGDSAVAKPEPPAPPPADRTPGAIAVGRVVVQPSQVGLDKGKSASLTVQLFGADGSAIRSGRTVTWSSSDPGVATVARGEVRAVSPGQVTITATVEGKAATATVTVRGAPEPAAVGSITIEPETTSLQVGRSVALVAQLRDARGAALTGRPVSWSVSDSSVLTVSATGQVTGRAPGSATVIATADRQSRRATITVMALPVATVSVAPLSGPLKPGATAQLVATARDGDGQLLTNRRAVWATSDPKVATVVDGLVTAREAGSATISATIDGRQGTVAVSVASPAPAVDPAAERARATAEITRQLDAFVDALNNKDLAQLKSAYPGMPPKFEEGWRNTMEQPRLNKLQATRDPLPPPKLTQDSAEVLFTLNLKPDYSGQVAKPFSIHYLAVFQNDGGKWQLRRLDLRDKN